MRILEIGLVGLLSVAAVWSLAAGAHSRRFLAVLLGLSLILLVFHLAREGAHWQMVPAYFAVLLFAGWFFFLKRIPHAGAWAMLVLVLLSCGLSAILPMFRLPRPTGPYAVGTRILYMVDENRLEDSIPGGGGKRELMVQLWYPAGASRNRYAPYRRRAETTLLSSYQSVLPTNSRLNAPVAGSGGAFPVLLFNHAWNGRRTQNTYLVEDLASHGFIVAGIDHTYNSDPVALPGGRVVQPIAVVEITDFAHSSWDKVIAAGNKELKRQAADDIFVLDRLQAINRDPESVFHGRFDTNRAGALGHSFGGAVAAEACSLDPRIRAALDVDGSLFGSVQKQGLNKPFMFIEVAVSSYTAEEFDRLDQEKRIDALLDQGDNEGFQKFGGYRIFIPGSTHSSYTDRALFSPLRALSGRGAIPPRREYAILRAYALAFFNQALKGESSPLLQPGARPFPEANPVFTGQASVTTLGGAR